MYAMGTSVIRTSNVHDLWKLGLAYDMPSKPVDGLSVEAVHEAMEEAVSRARRGDGPTFLEMKTYRYKGHSMSDAQTYRTKDEVKEYQKQDPIEKVIVTMKQHGWIDDAGIEEMEAKIKAMVDESIQFAEDSPYPEPEELFKDVYAEPNYPFIKE
jgi:pyruvate dehydrogenase E1 component alpha subunit